jgi:hypothetical protein
MNLKDRRVGGAAEVEQSERSRCVDGGFRFTLPRRPHPPYQIIWMIY